mgnify:FL=1
MTNPTGLEVAQVWLKAVERLSLAGYRTVAESPNSIRIFDGDRQVWVCSTVNELHAAAAIAEWEKAKAAKVS